MANRRMFALSVTDSDDFQSMPLSTQAIYFHLAMHADDDGFVGNPKRILRGLGGNEDEIKLLIAKRYVCPFNNGVCVIRHWKIHNLIQRDRYTPTIYTAEKRAITTDVNKAYETNVNDMSCIQDVYKLETQYRVAKESIGKARTEAGTAVAAYCNENGIPLTPYHCSEIMGFYEDGMTDEMMCVAVDEAVSANARNWKYIKAIIIGWITSDVKTIEQVRQAQLDFKARRSKQSPPEAPYSPHRRVDDDDD